MDKDDECQDGALLSPLAWLRPIVASAAVGSETKYSHASTFRRLSSLPQKAGKGGERKAVDWSGRARSSHRALSGLGRRTVCVGESRGAGEKVPRAVPLLALPRRHAEIGQNEFPRSIKWALTRRDRRTFPRSRKASRSRPPSFSPD